MKAATLAVIMASLPLGTAVAAQAQNTQALALKTKLLTVSLFKNGLGFVTRESELPNACALELVREVTAR